ncbi:hypothetical protein [Streptomyces sp. BPTC-684]|uniref:hypothetical protein n=1 Tax=Streptomyces sp. BPTC-684 TaxID=3043734 RepID=UPI0024B163DB|nr:hypothetical protein [Streptomyces sp. BPTC-684]WHM40930.1 hypothetical protein QIY60_31350 [Streptomyces sp. BPTC-684]
MGRAYHEIRVDSPIESEGPFPRTARPLADTDLLFALRLLLPGIRITTEDSEGGMRAWLHDGRSSWAVLITTNTTTEAATVYQSGERRLAHEIVAAWQQWEGTGAPGPYDFGMTRTEDQQYIFSNAPHTGPRWQPLTTAALPRPASSGRTSAIRQLVLAHLPSTAEQTSKRGLHCQMVRSPPDVHTTRRLFGPVVFHASKRGQPRRRAGRPWRTPRAAARP